MSDATNDSMSDQLTDSVSHSAPALNKGSRFNSEPPTDMPCILFRVADAYWAVDVASVHRVHKQFSVQSIPGTQPWFLGLAQFDGQLLPITDLGAWLDQSWSEGEVLHLASDFGPCGLRVDELMGTETLPVQPSALNGESIVMPGALPMAVAFNGINYRVVDMGLLVQSPAFVAVREASPA